MSATEDGLRQRGGEKKKPKKSGNGMLQSDGTLDILASEKSTGSAQPSPRLPASMEKKSEWDYTLACVVMTLLGFITRFWGISHPDQVVFDEVHFGKVCRR